MRYMAVKTFEIEGNDLDHATKRLRDLNDKIDRAAGGLGIGYKPGTLTGGPQPPIPPTPPMERGKPRADAPETDPTTLFDGS